MLTIGQEQVTIVIKVSNVPDCRPIVVARMPTFPRLLLIAEVVKCGIRFEVDNSRSFGGKFRAVIIANVDDVPTWTSDRSGLLQPFLGSDQG